MASLVNALTVDVEDYFQVSAMAPYISRTDWDSIECRVEANMDRILAIFDAASVSATFFTLGWIAERYPNVVKRIVNGGHELASHGYAHQRASELTRSEFVRDILDAKQRLEDISGCEVVGYRAPSFSIGEQNLWAHDCLLEAGYLYSSSIYPIRHDHYGMPDAPRFAHARSNGLIEVPVTTVSLFQRNWPASGGGYFRLLPYAVSRSLLRRVNTQDKQPAVFYFHPWEIDAGQPRVPNVNAKTKFRHYVNLKGMEGKIKRLVRDFSWDRMDRIYLADRT